jgi:tripartite-type tricarboxylate transporter receptor subunit TctC
MPARPIFLSAIVVGALTIGSGIPAGAQSFPDRMIRIVVPYPPGGPADVAARLIAPSLTSRLGQSVIIEN